MQSQRPRPGRVHQAVVQPPAAILGARSPRAGSAGRGAAAHRTPGDGKRRGARARHRCVHQHHCCRAQQLHRH